jgi:SNF2 family DNA or RNA helicase
MTIAPTYIDWIPVSSWGYWRIGHMTKQSVKAGYLPGGPPRFAHQTEGLKRLIENDGTYALLWDPGTMKTATVLDYLGWLATAAKQEVRVLVVCPKVVTDSWVSQAEAFLPFDLPRIATIMEGTINQKAAQLASQGSDLEISHPYVNIAVINLETLSSRRQVSKTSSRMHSDLLLDSVKKFAPHVLVVDESHRIKGKSSNAGRLLARMSKVIKRKILLTGTPMPHSPLDVWSQWRVLDDQVFATNGKPWSFSQFQQKYAVLGGYMGKEVKGFQYLDDLERRIATRSMSVRKEDALDLPPVMEITVPFTLEPAERKVYDKMKYDLLVELDSGEFMSAPSRLTQLLRLRQVTAGFVKSDQGNVTFVGQSRLNTTMSLLEDLMATEHRLVVFAWARPEVDRLVEHINKSTSLYGTKAWGITGDTPDAERLTLRQNFAKVDSSRQVLVCQWRTVSLGINEFVAASHAIFLSLSQQRDDLIQGKGRLDRQGQTKAVTFWWIQAPGTVDEVIRQSHDDRTNLEDALLAHVRGGSK